MARSVTQRDEFVDARRAAPQRRHDQILYLDREGQESDPRLRPQARPDGEVAQRQTAITPRPKSTRHSDSQRK